MKEKTTWKITHSSRWYYVEADYCKITNANNVLFYSLVKNSDMTTSTNLVAAIRDGFWSTIELMNRD